VQNGKNAFQYNIYAVAEMIKRSKGKGEKIEMKGCD